MLVLCAGKINTFFWICYCNYVFFAFLVLILMILVMSVDYREEHFGRLLRP